MKTKVLRYVTTTLTVLLVACTSNYSYEELDDFTSVGKTSSLKMNFQVEITNFDTNASLRRASWTWKDETVVFIQYHNGGEIVRGHAIYKASTNTWDAFFSGTLAKSDKCEVYYFDEASASNIMYVKLEPTNAIYADLDATYSVEGTEITIQASLSPLTSRIRFKESDADTITSTKIDVDGLLYYTGYDATKNSLITSASTINAQVTSNKYTPYYYCVFNNERRQLSIINNSDNEEQQFSKCFTSSVLQIGTSGYITIPTLKTNRGWEVEKIKEKFTINSNNGKSITFFMRKIKAGSFDMGNCNDGSFVDGHHNVTLTNDYYIGETEVTQALWFAIMGQSPLSTIQWDIPYGKDDNYPAYYVSYTDCVSFINSLNTKTGKKFRIPTEAEWEFAAKGGVHSNHFKYAGSNEIGEVAWYGQNSYDLGVSSPDFGTHAVKTKRPNELGLYDMTGNVWEWCYDWMGDYSSLDQSDPTGPTNGNNRILRGGSWSTSETGCRSAFREGKNPSERYSNIGIRLAM